MNQYERKKVWGLSNIHYCKNGVIKKIIGAKSVEVIFSQEYEYRNKKGAKAVRFNGVLEGKGKLEVVGLTLEEQANLLGYEFENGELKIGSSPNPPVVSLLFQREKQGGGSLLTVLYKVQFQNKNINSSTRSKNLEYEECVLTFEILTDTDKNLTCLILDTDNADKEKVENFFNKIQY